MVEFIDQEEIMAFSETFLTWEQETKNKGLQEGLQTGLQTGLEEGRQTGLEEGRQVGKQEERVEIAKKLLMLGLQVDAIAQATGLTMVQLQELQGELG
jgi:predicted transposase/invertase (TIGR01784 family)